METIASFSPTDVAADSLISPMATAVQCPLPGSPRFRGKRALVVQFSSYPHDPRPRRSAEALVEEGMRVELVCLSDASLQPKRELVNGVAIRRLPVHRSRGGKLNYMLEYGSFIFGAFVVLSGSSFRRRYDLVHVHNMPDVLVFSALIPRLLGAKVILDLHDPMPELMMTIFGLKEGHVAVRLLKRLEKVSIRFAHRVLTVNRACHKIFAGRSCSSEKVDVVMNSPDERLFRFRPCVRSEERAPAVPFVIMYHGAIVERHGLDLAVKALGIVLEKIPQAELRVYGGMTPFLQQVLSSLSGTKLASSVRHMGPKTLDQIATEIDSCSVGIVPNRRSIFTELNTPTRIFEYLARGKPVIAPAAPGVQDYFTEKQIIYFELGNPEDLARQIEYVYSHPQEATMIVEEGQRVYAAHLWHQERAKFLQIVGNLLRDESGSIERSA